MKIKFITLILIIAISLTGIYVWWKQAVKPAGLPNASTKKFSISTGETSRNIADRLFKEGIIRSPMAFFLVARFGGYGDKFQAGEFRLNPASDLYGIAEALTHGTADIWITVPEGWRNEQIALLVAQELSIPEQQFLVIAREGYMFPDTYLFPKEATAATVAQSMIRNFERKLTVDDQTSIKQKGLTLSDVVIIASLVEREAKGDHDRPIIASIILNRLRIGMKLDIDATIQYALGYQASEKSWWKKELTIEDLETKSTYNTYTRAGLPPAPISNPGIAALRAVINAPDTDYLYYISDREGMLHPAKTIEEHNQNVRKYLQ